MSKEDWICQNCGRNQYWHKYRFIVSYAGHNKIVCKRCKEKRIKMFGKDVLINTFN